MTYRPECVHFPCYRSWDQNGCKSDCWLCDINISWSNFWEINKRLGDYLKKIFTFTLEIIHVNNRRIVSIKDIQFAVRQFPIPPLIYNQISIKQLRRIARSEGVCFISNTGLRLLKNYVKTEKWGYFIS